MARKVADDVEGASSNASPRALPVFEGYTVDFRLREFRRVDYQKPSIDFVPFDSPKGRRLLKRIAEREESLGGSPL